MTPERSGYPARNGWSQLGIVLAVVVGMAGLVVLAAAVLIIAMMSSFGSNK